jgi:hypothetical protein
LRSCIRLFVGILVLFAALAPATAAGFRNVITSTTANATASTDVFAPDTAEVFIQADMVDIRPGSIVTITWLAVDPGVDNPPNFRLDRVSLRVGPVGRQLETSLPRPGSAWPVGSYSVRLAVNGQPVHRIDFTVR